MQIRKNNFMKFDLKSLIFLTFYYFSDMIVESNPNLNLEIWPIWNLLSKTKIPKN